MAIQLVCPKCSAQFQVKDELAGRRARCAKCQNVLLIPESKHKTAGTESNTPKTAPPATEKQKEYAESLGIDFPPDIDRRTISALIDAEVNRQDTDRLARLDDIDNRESKAYANMRAEIELEVNEEDPRLSKASIEQIMESLNEKNMSGVLISCPTENIAKLLDREINSGFTIMGSDDLDEDEMKSIVETAGLLIAYKSSQQ